MKFKPNAEYMAMYPQWTRCRDCAKGQDAVKAGGEKYLPRPSKFWTDDEYLSFKEGADFFNAFGRTVDTLTGLITIRDPRIEAPEGMDGIIRDVTMTGVPLNKYARRIVEEVLTVGRVGTLVDYPFVQTEGALSMAEVESLGLRPRLVMYPVETIWDWTQEWAGNRYLTTKVVLYESETTIRELALEMGIYVVRIWQKETKEKEEYILVSQTIPRMNGSPLTEIPFFIFDPIDGTWDMDQPPLLDLADMNISHYRTLAYLELGRAKTALPTFWATGVEPEDLTGGIKGQPVRIGSGNGLMTSKTDARFGMLEFTGQGLGALERADTQKRDMMSALGAAVIYKGSDNAEQSGVAAEINRQGESASLSSVSWSVSETLTMAMRVLAEWAGFNPDDVSVKLNNEFYQRRADPQEIMALFAQVQAGTMSARTLWEFMQKNGIIDREKTFEQNQEELEADAIAIMPSTGGDTNGDQ